MRPVCINPGCGRLAASMKGRVGQPGVRYRIFCGDCHIRSYNQLPMREGVTAFKKNQCSNLDGHLGFPCITDHNKFDQVSTKGKFEVDHIDRNPNNEHPTNLQELCMHCHKEKGIRQGDFDRYKKKDSTLINELLELGFTTQQIKPRRKASAIEQFNKLFE